MIFVQKSVFISVVAACAAFVSECADEKKGNKCVSGDVEECTCTNGDDGVRICQSNGSGWEDCSCGDTDSDCEADVTDFDTCLDCYCGDYVDTCNANTDCVDLLDCLNNCGSSDVNCEGDCSTQYPDGIDDLVYVLDCRDANCADYLDDGTDTDTDTDNCAADVTDFDTCLDCYCGDYADTCNANADCLDLLYCLNDCETTDTACQDDCAAQYADGVDDLFNVLNCRDDNCADYMIDTSECAADVTDFNTCLDCYCGTYVNTCAANADCLDLLYCLNDCETTDTACQDDCWTQYPNGEDDLLTVVYCLNDNCSEY